MPTSSFFSGSSFSSFTVTASTSITTGFSASTENKIQQWNNSDQSFFKFKSRRNETIHPDLIRVFFSWFFFKQINVWGSLQIARALVRHSLSL